MTTKNPTPSFTQRFIALGLLVLFINLLLFRPFGSLAQTFLLLGLGGYVVATFWQRPQLGLQWRWVGGFSVVFLLTVWNVFNRSNWVIHWLMVALGLGELMLLAYGLQQTGVFFRQVLELLLSPLRLLGHYYTHLYTAIEFPFSQQLQQRYLKGGLWGNRTTVIPLVTGVILAIPVVGVFLMLLTHADPIFAHYVQRWSGVLFSGHTPLRILFSVGLVAILSPLLFMFMPRSDIANLGVYRWFGRTTEVSVVLSLVAGVFALFLLIQWPYVFVSVAKETDLSRFGVATYSEYVTKGFGELLLVATLLFGLLWIGLLTYRQVQTKWRTGLLYIQLILVSELTVFVGSLLRRIWLYQAQHGWSLNRIYGGVFLIWLLAMLATFTLRHWQRRYWVAIECLITAGFVIGLGLFNAEAFVVRTHPPTVNDRVDYLYLARMSADGFEGWQVAFDQLQPALTTITLPKNEAPLSTHQQRQVIYGRWVISTLLSQYLDLTQKYGSEVERVQLYKQMLRSEKMILQDYLIQEPISSNLEATAGGRLAGVPQSLTRINEWLAAIDQSRVSSEQLEAAIELRSFHPYEDNVYLRNINLAVESSPSSDIRAWSDGDRWLNWNRLEYRAFRWLQQAIPLEKLLGLQRAYGYLHQRIDAYPSQQRSKEIDTNPQTVFLLGI